MIAVLLALASGVVLAAALPPEGLWPLVLVLALPFALTALAERPADAFSVGAALGLGFFGVYIVWLPLSFSDPGFLGPFFWLLHPVLLVVLALMWGLTTWAARLVGGRGALTAWLLAPTWVLVEWARGQGYFAFPWGTLGYAWTDTPLAQAASLVGVHGLSLTVTVAAAALATPFLRTEARTRRGAPAWLSALPALVVLALLGALWWWGAGELRRELGPLQATALLVQPNVDPFGRATSAAQELETHLTITELGVSAMAAAPDLVLWPEGALTGYDPQAAGGEALVARIQAASPGSTFVIGGRGRDAGRSFNSAFVLEGGALLGRYDKHVLVPFGERWPLIETLEGVYRGVFAALNLPMLVSTSPGPGPVPLASRLGPLATAICYESVIPAVSARMVADGARVLLVITNDAWFARGNGARQHLDMGRLRAIETRRFVLRAANDGITGAIDPYGRLLVEYPRFTAGHLAVRVGLRDEITPFVRHGHLTPWLLVAATALLAGAAGARRLAS